MNTLGSKEAPDSSLHLPEPLLVEGYQQAAEKNLLAALNPNIFFGYFSATADGEGHGSNATFPGLDWGQSCEALLWLGRLEEVLASWNYVRAFQREDGALPLAILPDCRDETLTTRQDFTMQTAENGGLYEHWVPGNPLATLPTVTFIQAADAIYRQTLDSNWLREQWPWLQRAGEHLATFVTPDGLVSGAGFYIERPTRIEYDGVNQCYTAHAFRLLAALGSSVHENTSSESCRQLESKISACFRKHFWAGDHCVEYIHPQHGAICHHGLTDVDWIATATEMLSADRQQLLWPQLAKSDGFIYDGIPTGIATKPETYEDWEMQNIDRHDLAAMGRVWFLESWARAQMEDAEGLLTSLSLVLKRGQADGWYWNERYYSERTTKQAAYDIGKYCEYPANLIRIVQRFLLGVQFELDGSLTMAPCVPADWWRQGFGQKLEWRGQMLEYRISEHGMQATWRGGAQSLKLRLPLNMNPGVPNAQSDGVDLPVRKEGRWLHCTLPATEARGSVKIMLTC